tara:strand:+ start:48798 stop:49328 length:531 start_codon:yes stop_codon:yes gene_type:complete
MNFNLTKLSAGLLLVIGLFSCQEPPVKKPPKLVSKKELIQNNRQSVRVESDQIDMYVKRRDWTMNQTGSGLRYMIYESTNKEGQIPKENDTAFVSYTVSLINGKEVYKSTPGEPASFIIGHDVVESGLQEGILFMKTGDKAIMIIPAHLAHGYSGDFNKIPRSSTVIFDIELLELR